MVLDAEQLLVVLALSPQWACSKAAIAVDCLDLDESPELRDLFDVELNGVQPAVEPSRKFMNHERWTASQRWERGK